MIGVFLTFRYTDKFEPELIRHIAESARQTFEGRAGLRSKAFTLNLQKREAVNFYIWEDEAASQVMSGHASSEGGSCSAGPLPSSTKCAWRVAAQFGISATGRLAACVG